VKILLFGKDGQVGWELQRSLTPLGALVALGRDSQEYCGDLNNPEKICRTIQALQPSVIVNAAAYTAVDKTESEPELARTINAETPAAIAEEAQRCGALLIHYSTDYVFDGSGSQSWAETDGTGPLNIYGATKLESEKAISDSGCHHLIFRTSWVYGTRGGNFAKTMLRLAKERDQLNVINDQIGAPTGADLIADVTAHAIRMALNDTSINGIFHLVAAGETSWHTYARFVIETARQADVKVKVAPNAVLPVPTSAYPTVAKRPLNSRLGTSKLRNTFNLTLPHWQTGVARMLAEILETYHD
jgi:dTDP-4-dehydrorhamnose reductase